MTETKAYRLKIELLEDLHSGSGTGGGDIDALQMRDRHGRPVIRETHLRGVLLAAAEELVQLGAATAQEVQSLLGKTATARRALGFTSLRLAGDSKGQTLQWTSTARVKGDRRPDDDSMRIVEHVAAGNQFAAELRLSANEAHERLLKRLLNRLDRLGSDRNRGGGLIRATWQELDPRQGQKIEIKGPRIRLRLRNLEPLCLPDTGHPGNLIASHPFIRGQALRGALLRWALDRKDPAAIAALKKASVGDALPLPPDLDAAPLGELQVMPVPLSILAPKPGGGNSGLPWWAAGGGAPAAFDDLGDNHPPAEEKPKRPGVREYLARKGDGPWLRYSPLMRVHMRNQTADLAGRDLSGNRLKEPQLFSLEEIAEESRFLAELTFPSAEDAAGFAQGFAPVLAEGEWLGIGREGRPVMVETTASLLASEGRDYSNKEDWTLTLTADTVLRGPWLGFLTDLDIPALARLANIEPAPDWKMRGYAETQPLQGFNAASGLRRIPALAIRRGSCWCVTGPGCGQLATALAKLPALGERVAEGCGRFVIDAQPIAGLEKPAGAGPAIGGNRHESLLAAAHDLAGLPGAVSPSLSQLQWLRERALAATSDRQLQELLEEIHNAPERRPQGGKAWEGFPHQRLREQIARLATLEDKRLLISHLVQWLAPKAKAKAQENRQ